MKAWFISRALHEARIDTVREQVKTAERYIATLESELGYYRRKFEEAIVRADRQLDSLHQQVGLPAVTAVGIEDQANETERLQIAYDEHEAQMAEIMAEQMDNLYDENGFELPSELATAASKMIGNA